MRPSWNLDRPLRVGAVQIAVLIHHLRLNPDTEGKTERGNFFRQSGQTRWQFFAVFHPVAERARVSVTLAEPSVIENEKLDSKTLRLFRETDKEGFVNVKVRRFPAVK